MDGKEVGRDDEAVGVLAALSAAGLDDPSRLAALTLAELESALKPAPGAGPLPMLDRRLECLVELGRGLCGAGGVRALLDRADGSAVAFVNLLVAVAPNFRDVRRVSALPHDELSSPSSIEAITFAKRAQLCASMLHGCGAATFTDLHRLTVFSE